MSPLKRRDQEEVRREPVVLSNPLPEALKAHEQLDKPILSCDAPWAETCKANTAMVWGASPAGTLYGGGAEPGTRAFFEAVLERRSTHEQPWLWATIPLSTFKGRRVLEVGCGAGYDAFEIMRAGADYSGVDITPENPARTLKHLSLFGMVPKVQVADAEDLPFDDGAFDVVFSNGVLHHTPHIEIAFREVARVTRPGGEFWLIVYHRNSVFYWLKLWLLDQVLRGGFRKRTMAERLSLIEYTTSEAKPLVKVYSRAELGGLLRGSGFSVDSIVSRKLVAEDLPDFRGSNRVYKHIPQSWLDRLAKRFGWYLIAHARRV